MADPVLPGGIRVLSILQGISGLPEDRYVNTWAFSSDVAESEAGQLAAVAKVGNFFDDTPATGQRPLSLVPANSIDETACEFRVYWMGQAPPRTPLIVPWSVGTLSSAQAIPSECAVCVSYYAGVNQPRSRGRVYFGPLTIGAVDDTTNQPPGVASPAVNGLRANALALAEDTTGPRWCVLGLNAGGSAKELKIITAGWVDNAFDTQRRRGEDATARTTFAVA